MKQKVDELKRWNELTEKAHLIIMNYLDTYAPEPLGEIMDNLPIESFGILALPGDCDIYPMQMQRLEELLDRFFQNTDPAILSQVDPS